MSLEIISLGVAKVNFGVNGDQDRVKKIVGEFPRSMPLNLERFPYINNWPRGTREVNLGIVWPHKPFSSYDEIVRFLYYADIKPEQLTLLPHLVAGVIPFYHKLLKMYLQGEGPGFIFASDIVSVWQYASCDYLPFICLFEHHHKLMTHQIDHPFSKLDGFMVTY